MAELFVGIRDANFHTMTTIKDFSAPQKQALLDLAMLAMYADGHLAISEDERVNRLLGSMGFTSDVERTAAYDASISRIARHSQTAEAALLRAKTLTQSF